MSVGAQMYAIKLAMAGNQDWWCRFPSLGHKRTPVYTNVRQRTQTYAIKLAMAGNQDWWCRFPSLVFLEIQNVTIWSVLLNLVT